MKIDDFSMNVAGAIDQAARNGLEAVARWLTEQLRRDVGHQTGMGGPGSRPPNPPFRRSGHGQEAITFAGPEDTEDGACVKIGYPPEAPGPAYMVYHDQGITYKHAGWQRRKWLSDALNKYKPEIIHIFVSNFRT